MRDMHGASKISESCRQQAEVIQIDENVSFHSNGHDETDVYQ
jgi:hypothetical protein